MTSYIEARESIRYWLGDDDAGVLKTISDRYIGANPEIPFSRARSLKQVFFRPRKGSIISTSATGSGMQGRGRRLCAWLGLERR